MDIHALLRQPVVLPSQPRAVALLKSALAQAQPSLRRLNQIVGSDPALAAQLLQQANGPAYGLQGQVGGIAQALVLVDTRQLPALAGQVVLGTTSGSVPGVNLQAFWRYSLNTAKLARSLAGLVHHDQILACTAGLLHGLGELAMHLFDARRMHDINDLAGPLDIRRGKLELRLLGFCYGQVSAGLARQWDLPQTIIDALRYHSAPFANNVYEPLAGVLHLAAWRARAREAAMGDREMVANFPGEVGVALGLDIDMVLQQDPIDWSAQPDDD